MVSIKGLNKAAVLVALYNNSHQQGLGFLHTRGAAAMTVAQAQDELDRSGPSKYFDYLHGRVMKVGLESDTEFNERLYDRDNGPGAAQRAIDELRASL